MAAPIEVVGDEELLRALDRLPRVVRGKILRPAMRAAMKIVQVRAQAEAPVLTGATKDAIKVRAAAKKKRGQVTMETRIDATPALVEVSKAGKRYFIPAVVQYGHRDAAPNPFMTRAYHGAGPGANRVATRDIWRGIEAEAKAGRR